jgi:hypothetical protein
MVAASPVGKTAPVEVLRDAPQAGCSAAAHDEPSGAVIVSYGGKKIQETASLPRCRLFQQLH